MPPWKSNGAPLKCSGSIYIGCFNVNPSTKKMLSPVFENAHSKMGRCTRGFVPLLSKKSSVILLPKTQSRQSNHCVWDSEWWRGFPIRLSWLTQLPDSYQTQKLSNFIRISSITIFMYFIVFQAAIFLLYFIVFSSCDI